MTTCVRAKYPMSLRQALEKLRSDIGKETRENHLNDVCFIREISYCVFHVEFMRLVLLSLFYMDYTIDIISMIIRIVYSYTFYDYITSKMMLRILKLSFYK